MKKSLKTLAKELEFNSELEYFTYCIETYINGQRTQCRNLFNAMKKEDQKELLNFINRQFVPMDEIYNFYFNLL